MDTYNTIRLFSSGQALFSSMLGTLSVFAGLILSVMPRAVARTLKDHSSTKVNGKGD